MMFHAIHVDTLLFESLADGMSGCCLVLVGVEFLGQRNQVFFKRNRHGFGIADQIKLTRRAASLVIGKQKTNRNDQIALFERLLLGCFCHIVSFGAGSLVPKVLKRLSNALEGKEEKTAVGLSDAVVDAQCTAQPS